MQEREQRFVTGGGDLFEGGSVQNDNPPDLVLGVDGIEDLVLDLSNGRPASEEEGREQRGLLPEGPGLKLVPEVGDQVLREVVAHDDILPLSGDVFVTEGRQRLPRDTTLIS